MQKYIKKKKIKASEYIQSGNYHKAISILGDILEKYKQDGHSWFLLAAAYGQVGNYDAAINCGRIALKLDPNNVGALSNLATAYMHRKEYSKSMQAYKEVLRRSPTNMTAISNLGYLLKLAGRNDESIECLKKALIIDPCDDSTLNNLGNAYSGKFDNDNAIKCYQRAIEINPQNALAYNNLGSIYHRIGRYGNAIKYFTKALELDQNYVDAIVNKGVVLQSCGKVRDADKCFRRAMLIEPSSPRTVSGFLFNLNYYCDDPEESFREHVRATKHISNHSAGKVVVDCGDVNARLMRIGYVSADFYRHSVAYFFEALALNHNKQRFEIICYSDVHHPDDVTAKLRKHASIWRDITHYSAAEVVAGIRNDKIDILVDLAGHTAPKSVEIFSERCAPIQVNWLGYPNTSGLKTIDYRLTDVWADPPGRTDRFHTEKLIRLPGGFLSYSAPREAHIDTGALPAGLSGHMTFGSFNNLAKVTPALVELWSRILLEVPNSRLILKNKSFHDVEAREYFYRLFGAHGISSEQIEFLGLMPPDRHFKEYNRIDIALDTYPYSGTTTTCEALWMGVPVITLAGKMHAGRVGVSLLTQLALEGWIANDEDEYVELAKYWAAQSGKLSALRMELRERLKLSDLCNGKLFASKVEQAYNQIWSELITNKDCLPQNYLTLR